MNIIKYKGNPPPPTLPPFQVDLIKATAIAKVAHEANRAYCAITGDSTQPPWDGAPQWQRDLAISGVLFHSTAVRSAEESHANWVRDKEAAGWVYGPVKNTEAKTHPCLMPYDQLPLDQRRKDALFKAIVETLK